MSVVWLFLRVGLLRYDDVKLIDVVRTELVDNSNRLRPKNMDEIATTCKISYGSTKITLAFLVGKQLGSVFWSTGLVLLVILPSMILTGLVLYACYRYLSTDYLHLVRQGCIPVLAALFMVKGWEYARQSWQQLSRITWLLIALLSVVLLVVLELGVALALLILFVFLLCFFKGGNMDD